MSSVSLSVLDFGAKGDGVTEDTQAFDEALQTLKRSGGGTLIVNANKVYLIGPLHIQTSHLIVSIQDNVTIRGIPDASVWQLTTQFPSHGVSDRAELFRHVALIHGTNLQNVTFQGQGYQSIVHGNGEYWWNRFRDNSLAATRPNLMEFQYSQDVNFHQLRLVDSPYWNWVMFDCDRIHVKNMWIEAAEGSPNTDGFDPSSSRHVVIEDSSYIGGDDCIAVKSGYDCFGVWYDTPCEYLYVRNVTCQGDMSGSVALGSELSGGIRHVLMEDLHFPGKVKKAIEIKTGSSRGGWIHNVTFQDITITGTPQHPSIHLDMLEYSEGDSCIYENCRNRGCPSDWEPLSSPPRITNVTIQRMNGMAADLNGEWHGETFHFAALSPDQSPCAEMTGIHLKDIFFPPQAKWSCKGPIEAEALNVFPGPPCFDTTYASTSMNAKQHTLTSTLNTPKTLDNAGIEATKSYGFMVSLATLLAAVMFLFTKRAFRC